jgi:hypothetical protein
VLNDGTYEAAIFLEPKNSGVLSAPNIANFLANYALPNWSKGAVDKEWGDCVDYWIERLLSATWFSTGKPSYRSEIREGRDALWAWRN